MPTERCTLGPQSSQTRDRPTSSTELAAPHVPQMKPPGKRWHKLHGRSSTTIAKSRFFATESVRFSCCKRGGAMRNESGGLVTYCIDGRATNSQCCAEKRAQRSKEHHWCHRDWIENRTFPPGRRDWRRDAVGRSNRHDLRRGRNHSEDGAYSEAIPTSPVEVAASHYSKA